MIRDMKLIKTRNNLIVLILTTLLGGCGDDLFERLIFSPAMQLAQSEQLCENLPRGYTCDELNPQEVFFQSGDGTNLQAVFLKNPDSERLLIYFHGNGSHIYFRMRFAVHMVKIANVLIVSYRGYGKSEGKPSEAGLYADGEATLDYALNTLGFDEPQIYLYGRSLGGAVAIYNAQNRSLGGVILVSTFSSGYDLAFDRGLDKIPGLTRPFDSIQYLQNIQAPILFIHGDRDRLVPIHHSEKLYSSYQNNRKMLYVLPDIGHWGIHRIGNNLLWERIDAFVNPSKARSENESALSESKAN